MRSLPPRERLALPLDVPELEQAQGWIEKLASEVGVFKVGLELFTAAGPEAVRAVHNANAACFLDLKLHDIPATMARAVSAADQLGTRYLTVHASAGEEALAAARGAAKDVELLAVTALTSLDDQALVKMGWSQGTEAYVDRLADAAYAAGIRAFVCSAHECARLRSKFGEEVLLVVPGIRPEADASDDQKRIATPQAALENGADILVVGRPIRNASDPKATAHSIVEQIRGVKGT